MAAFNLTPIFDNIIKQRRLALNIFSFYFDRNSNSSNSRFIMGGIDFSLIRGKINWHKIIGDFFWEFKADNILVNNKDIGLCNKCSLIADTGTSLITGPSQRVQKILCKLIKKNDKLNLFGIFKYIINIFLVIIFKN